MLVQSMWTHGHSIAVEWPQSLRIESRTGFSARFVGKPPSDFGVASVVNWFHFAIPSPAIMFKHRLNLEAVIIRFRNQAAITKVHVFDGERRLQSFDGLSLTSPAWDQRRFELPQKPELSFGVGISVQVTFSGGSDDQNTVEFAAAGADFIP
jgi:hypothetical protein